jgi:NAD(P)-dependent dehydrogenase (short-subunit alcohol dehydrogenase family)
VSAPAAISLVDRRAIITGASEGLGAAIAAEYLRQGANVALCAREPKKLEETRSSLQALAGPLRRVLARACDVSKPGEVASFVDWALAEMPDIDVLVNNAGIYGPLGRVEETDWQAWVQAIETNLYGPVLFCRALIPHLKARGRGKIIQLSGGGATAPLARRAAYCASKAAVVRFAETLAIELLPHHIDVNCISPGALNTRMLDEVLAAGPAVGEDFYRKSIEQRDQGGAPIERGTSLAVFLASSASDGITGRLISAIWDPWEELPSRRQDLAGSDIYTLRRIVPADRGKPWGGGR